jgi:AcrR family transcriptional regulator
MARPRSEDKRNAILTAATTIFAERGLGAATSAISASAGVAEGSLFRYFPTKDDLVNALYCELKLELGDALMAGYPRRKSIKERVRHVWNAYLSWGMTNPEALRALRQMEVWSGLTAAARAATAAPFAELQAMAESSDARRLMRPELSFEVMTATLKALAEATMDFMRLQPRKAEAHRLTGFEMLWAAITRD